jgi:hypothetical protein
LSVDDSLKQAQAALKKNDASGAVRALEDALLAERAKADLEVRVACPINHDHTGIGLYTPAKNDVVDGRRVRLYVEVANFALAELSGGAGHAQLDVTGDFSFEDPAENGAAKKLQSNVSLGTQAFDTRTRLGVTSFGVEVGLGEKSPAGTYHVLLRVKDAIGNKTATKDVRFVLT